MALTTKQLCLINNLMYSEHPSVNGTGPQDSYEGLTVGDMVKKMSASANADNFTSREEWQTIINEIKNDPQLMNVQIRDTYYDSSTGDRRCLLVDPSTNEAVVAFRGTGGGEWKDDFIAGTTMDGSTGDKTISPQQQKAVDYVDDLDLSGYDTVTVTGHSKGGNKAKLVALMNDDVDRCVSFDGQGFSDEFMDAHRDEIARNQHKIQNHNVENDFVNILLNDVGDTTYYKGYNNEGNFAKNHAPSTFFSNDGEMSAHPHDAPYRGQDPNMYEMDRFVNSMIRSMDPEKRAKVLEFAGELADGALGFDKAHAAENLRRTFLDRRYTEQAADMLAYLLEYEHKTGKITNAVSSVLDQMGFGDKNYIVDIVRTVISSDFLYGIVKTAARRSDSIPDSVISFFRRQFNIPLSDEELRQLLRIITRTGEKTGTITVDPDNGADKKVSDSPAGKPEAALPRSDWMDRAKNAIRNAAPYASQDVDISVGMVIFVQFEELRASCEELNQAVACYNDAIDLLRGSAEDLASKWMGDAKDAFVANQEDAFGWYVSMANIVTDTIRKVMSVHSLYHDTEGKLSSLIRG